MVRNMYSLAWHEVSQQGMASDRLEAAAGPDGAHAVVPSVVLYMF